MPASGKALLFDIDGTLTDTDALHLEAFNEVLGPHGHVFDHARFTKELQGFSNASISERFLAGQLPERQAAIMGEKEQAFRKLVAGRIQPLPGLMALLAQADRASVPMVAVAQAECGDAAFRTWHFRPVQVPRHRRRAATRQAASDALSGRPARRQCCA
jgi:beta-phosphoglucomutase-like phosphatase (HAD superfamily)